MPFGHRRVQVGLMLRYAMFANGILCNSEAWHNITKKTHRRTRSHGQVTPEIYS